MAKNCPKMATFGYIGHKRVLDAPNGWNEVEQGWNKWGDIWAGGLGPFFRSEIAISGLRGGWKWPKMCFVAISSSGGPKWVEQSGTRVEQVRGHMGQWVGTFLPFRFCLQWAPEGLNMAKPLPPCLETPAAKNKNSFSVFLGPQIMKKKCDHCLIIIYIHFENNRNCFWSPKNKKSDLYGNMPYKRTVAGMPACQSTFYNRIGGARE